MVNVALYTNTLREELESLISLKGLNHREVLKLSEKLDKYIIMHYLKKELIDDTIKTKWIKFIIERLVIYIERIKI